MYTLQQRLEIHRDVFIIQRIDCNRESAPPALAPRHELTLRLFIIHELNRTPNPDLLDIPIPFHLALPLPRTHLHMTQREVPDQRTRLPDPEEPRVLFGRDGGFDFGAEEGDGEHDLLVEWGGGDGAWWEGA